MPWKVHLHPSESLRRERSLFAYSAAFAAPSAVSYVLESSRCESLVALLMMLPNGGLSFSRRCLNSCEIKSLTGGLLVAPPLLNDFLSVRSVDQFWYRWSFVVQQLRFAHLFDSHRSSMPCLARK